MTTYSSRYDFGLNIINHRGKKITTSLNTTFMDSVDSTAPGAKHAIGRVKQYISHRPDTISDIFYNSASYWWYFLLYNNINDPFERLNPSDLILLPPVNDLLS